MAKDKTTELRDAKDCIYSYKKDDVLYCKTKIKDIEVESAEVSKCDCLFFKLVTQSNTK